MGLVCSVMGLGIECSSHYDLISCVLRTGQFCVFILHMGMSSEKVC